MFGLSTPQRFMAFTGSLTPVLWAAAALLLAIGTWLSFSVPADYQQGDTVRIMFVHVPAASARAWRNTRAKKLETPSAP